MLRQTLVLQHVHQRGLARVVQALWCEEEGKVSPPFARAPDPIRLVGSKERWVLAERRAREARRALTLTLARARENPTPEMEGSSTVCDSSMSTDSRDVSLYAQRLSSG